MERIYKTSLLLTTDNCDMTGAWKPSAIMDAMQEGAGRHGEKLGFGRDMLDPLGLAWVISRLEVQMDRYPRIGETVELETFPTGNRRAFFPRYYVMRDASGTEIGRAVTLWLLMDIRTRRMAGPEAVKHLLPDNRDLTLPMGLPAPLAPLDGDCSESVYQPRYSDLDVNMHVNNIRYMDMCCNALGIETMMNNSIGHFSISFDKEIRADQTLTLQLRRSGSLFSFTGTEGDARHFEIGGELTGR